MISRILFGMSLASGLMIATQPALSQGDLLVAPTRLIMEGSNSGEVIVSNSGNRASNYRISLVLRRMDAAGQLKPVEETQATAGETAALEMINYAPRKISLAPGQSQTIRIGVRPPPTIAPGEYRAHLLFRAIPDAPESNTSGAATPQADGMSIALTPIYGVTIPIIVRVGAVAGEAKIVSAQFATRDGKPGVNLELGHSGQRSIYGTIQLDAAAQKTPIALVKGVAVYPEISQRSVFIPLEPGKAAASRTTLTARFIEAGGDGKANIAELPVR